MRLARGVKCGPGVACVVSPRARARSSLSNWASASEPKPQAVDRSHWRREPTGLKKTLIDGFSFDLVEGDESEEVAELRQGQERLGDAGPRLQPGVVPLASLGLTGLRQE